MKLTVKEAPKSAAGNDIIHINMNNRGGIAMNTVCKIKVGEKHVYATVRGSDNAYQILIDNQLRLQLGIKLDHEYDFSIDHKPYYFFIAPLHATNTGVKASYTIACFSVLISLISLFISLSPF